MEVANHPSIWLHVDAAWAGVAFALPEYREKGQLPAINRFADPFCTNFHKVGFRLFFTLHKGAEKFSVGPHQLRLFRILGQG
jgi:glutamate/tyrosine decarboxylase-like PLP-dependent enzyme